MGCDLWHRSYLELGKVMLLNLVLVDDDVLDDRGSVDGGTSRLCSARDDVGYATGRCWLCSNMICVREGTLSSFSPPAKGRLQREVVLIQRVVRDP